MPDQQTLFAILLMALTTYATRIASYMILRNRVLSPRSMAVLKSSPGCVMLAFIAPYFASGNPADLIALDRRFTFSYACHRCYWCADRCYPASLSWLRILDYLQK